MNISDLPAGSAPAALDYPHFPTRWQHVLWRNWELVPPERLAALLRCSLPEILESAEALGLPVPPKVNPKWLPDGYLTLIRNNWQLLDYAQLLELLGWTPEKLAYSLKEEDFLFHKLGKLKPQVPEVRLTVLDDRAKARTAEIRATVVKYFPKDELRRSEEAFAFAGLYKPVPPLPEKNDFEFNFIHAFAASCGDVLGEAETSDPVPENLLARYASMGIKGVWLHAILYLLRPIPGAESFSRGWEKRVANLRKIAERCGKYGMKVYLYLNEPRWMPESFFDLKPRWKGRKVNEARTICTTAAPEVLTYLEEALFSLFSQVPELGGILTITMSENATNCHYDTKSAECPFCSKVPPEKIIADINSAMERGMHRAAPEAKMLIYDWSWRRDAEDMKPLEFKKKVIDLLPKHENVFITCVSEWGMETHVGGVKQYLRDYSISQVGPAGEAKAVWAYAREKGLKTAAKVQINNSWELAAVPSIPVPYLIREHLDKLRKERVSGLMLSWTLGGFPGGNLEQLRGTPEEVAAQKFGPATAEKVCRAWRLFSEAFRNFPHSVGVVYNAPMNYGPMNLLYLQPSGYRATMVGFPYDHVEAWRNIYPEEVFVNQFQILTDKWREGLEMLKLAAPGVSAAEREDFEDIRRTAETAFCHFESTLLQTRFTLARRKGDRETMRSCAEEEREIALKLYKIARTDSRIGFEASNHYFYTLNDLREKVINCSYILEQLEKETRI